MPKKQPKRWSYSAGERGRNRVRVYENRQGMLYVEFYERQPNGTLVPTRRSLGHRDRRRAATFADRTAAQLGDGQSPQAMTNPTLRQLFDNYVEEVSKQKGAMKQAHDRRTARMFLRLFGPTRRASSLSIRDWDRFIELRRTGQIGPQPHRTRPVGNRQIEYDLKFLLAVLNWATKAKHAGGLLLASNPLRGLTLPKERNPKRPVMRQVQYDALRVVAERVSVQFALSLVLAHETGHRIGAISMLRWSDIDFEHETITWRAEHDKTGHTHKTPLTGPALDALKQARRSRLRIGDSWVLPSPKFPNEACSRQALSRWMQEAWRLAGLGDPTGIGYHSLRRKFATDLKPHVPLKDIMALGGWRDHKTLLESYQHADMEAMRTALEQRAQSTHQSTHPRHAGSE